jgi:hypothetical protein
MVTTSLTQQARSFLFVCLCSRTNAMGSYLEKRYRGHGGYKRQVHELDRSHDFKRTWTLRVLDQHELLLQSARKQRE